MNLSVLPNSRNDHDSINDVLREYVDSFFIDAAKASVEMPSGALVASFSADFFGEYRVIRDSVGILRDDLRLMASLAAEFFERTMTECASHGAMLASDRPIVVPEGLRVEFTPCEQEHCFTIRRSA